jgi:hypothetical protein
MIYSAEYTVKIKLESIFMPQGHTDEELTEEITSRGREDLKKYFNGVLFDPNKKIIFEKTNSEIKK